MASINADVKIPKRILNTLITSLSAGVVPRIGAPYIAIGREEEIGTLLNNLDEVEEGGAACRFLIGRYGSGKSFLIQLIRGRALERGFICADADLSPERRLTGGSGAGLATYKELMINMATKASPDGGALTTILSRHYAKLAAELAESGIMPDDPLFEDGIRKKVIRMLSELEGDVGGFDFARVLGEYYVAAVRDDQDKKSACVRWLRGEFANKTEANSALGFRVSTVIDDENWYGYIKLFASLSVKLGYSGFIVFIDECVNLYKIPNRISREANYEKLLSIFNDTLQGKAKNLGIIFGGTPQFLEDTRRGLFSYDALKSRLADTKYTAVGGYQNLSSPVIRLRTLSGTELLALTKRLTNLYAMRDGAEPLVSDSEIEDFVAAARSRAGADEMLTPREIIRDYLSFLNILRDNKNVTFKELLLASGGSASDILDEETPFEEKSEEQRRTVSLFDIDI